MKFGLSLVLSVGLLAGSLAPAAALPMLGGPAAAPESTLNVEKVYYRCGYYGCRRRVYYPAYRYYRPYGYGYYRRPGIGIGIGPLGIGVY